MKTLIVRYGELTLKGKNREYFVTKLIKNIKFKLKKFREQIVYVKDRNSLTLELTNNDIVDDVISILQKVFGIYSLSISEKVDNDIEKIKEKVLEMARELPKCTFKLEVYRKDKNFPIPSQDLKRDVAAYILTNTDHLKVDVHHPESQIEIVIKSKNTFIYTSKIKASKGLPVGVSGSCVSLISGGIDSPVASYLTMKRGMIVNFLHFMTPPHTTPEALKKVFDLVEKVSEYNNSSFALYVFDFNDILIELRHMEDPSYRITIMRRMFMRIANLLAKKIGANAIITGESLGQVASQTIESMTVINETSEIPVLRPVITFDKEDIIKIAKDISTYDISIRPFDDVCSLYVPKNPVTKPKSFVASKLEDSLMWNELIENGMQKSIKRYILREGEWHEKEWEES